MRDQDEGTGQATGPTRRAMIGSALLAGLVSQLPQIAVSQTSAEMPMSIDPSRSALVLLHYQTDILAIFADAGIDAYVQRMARLAEAARAAGVPVYLVRIGFSPDYREISPNNQNGQMVRSFGLFTGDTIPDALRGPGDTEITAHRVSAFKGTDLDLSLRARGVDTLMMAGITTTGVVFSTLAEASDLDYRILLIADGCFEPDTPAQEALLRVPFATRAEITDTDSLLALL
ncbi:cysteine hydrolase [Cereibacter sphaeroides]|nr:cysteine hydrolase [Cereibacter sphaeroides]